MTEKIKNIILKYFSEQNIDNITISDKRIIVVLKNADESKSSMIESDIKQIAPDLKVSVMFIKEKAVSGLNQKADDKWNIKNVKKIIAGASGKG